MSRLDFKTRAEGGSEGGYADVNASIDGYANVNAAVINLFRAYTSLSASVLARKIVWRLPQAILVKKAGSRY